MKNGGRPARVVGNEFLVPRPGLQIAAAAPAVNLKPVVVIPVVPEAAPPTFAVAVHSPKKQSSRLGPFQHLIDYAHKHSLVSFALLFLAVGASGLQVAAGYRTAQIEASVPQNFHVSRPAQPRGGINMSVPVSQLAPTLQTITAQPASFTIGNQTAALGGSTLKSWLQVVTDHKTNTAYIHVNDTAINASLQALAQKYSAAAVNQVSVDHGGGPQVISPGRNGLQVSVPDGLAKSIAKTLLAAKGMEAPLNAAPQAFQAVTPAAFSKLIEVNLVTKQMYLYQNGQLYKSYAVSAGKPSTPTPIGQFHIFEKLAVQDMRGTNPNGTPYFQPHVHWINYFLPGGFAIHGVYWHPPSWFGAINSSHGCVGLLDDQAQEVYDWAPLGTTVITHT